MRFYQEMAHRSDCGAVEMVKNGTWASPWSMEQQTEYRLSDGRPGSGDHKFVRLRCNSLQCSAVVWVSTNDLLQALADQMGVGMVSALHAVKPEMN